MRIVAILLSLLAFSCTQTPVPTSTVTSETGVFSQAATGGVALDSYGFSFVPIGSSPVTSKSATVSTLGPNRVLVAEATMINSNVTMAISDSAGLTWQPVGSWIQDEESGGVFEGYIFLNMWAARAPTKLTNDTVTVKFNKSAGASIGVLAAANADMPIGFIHSSDPTFSSPAFTMNTQPGSILFGGAGDVSGDCCFAWAPMSNTTLKGGDGYTANDYGAFWTTNSVAGGPVTFGTTKVISGQVRWGGIAAEIPVVASGVQDGGSGDIDAGTPDAGIPDAGEPDAGVPDAGMDGGTCSWVCQ